MDFSSIAGGMPEYEGIQWKIKYANIKKSLFMTINEETKFVDRHILKNQNWL